MTMTFDISSNLKKVSEGLIKKHQRQIPFAARAAVNKTATRVHKYEKIKAKQEIDKPIPFTLNGITLRKARPNDKRIAARIFIKRIQWSYLKYITKRSVRYPKGKFIGVPITENVALNKYGNVKGKKKGLIKNDRMFSGIVKGASGIWIRGSLTKKRKLRKGQKTLKLAFAYKSQVRYEETFHYFDHAKFIINRWVKHDMDMAMKKAIRTAR